MRRIGFVFAVALLLCGRSFAQEVKQADCLTLLMEAEEQTGTDTALYDACGFNDEKTAWEKWSAVASEKKMKKALFELCVRYPNHSYGSLYCDKSAQLGYAPAIAQVGHRELKNGNDATAMRLYKQALSAGELMPEQEGAISENLGVYYLTPDTAHFDVEKGIAFLRRAASVRSALANNILGYAALTGAYGVSMSNKSAFKYFWRAILLGCPSAEENLGLFHLTRLGEIDMATAKWHIERNLFSCTPEPFDVSVVILPERKECDCAGLFETEKRYRAQPYLLLEVRENGAVLQKKDGSKLLVRAKEKQQDGYFVDEIRSSAVILTKGKERVILNLYKKDDCLDYCVQKQAESPEAAHANRVVIKPYRLTFTADECETIKQYAPALVDINLPFTGKTVCYLDDVVSSAADDPLLQLMDGDDKEDTPNDKVDTTITPLSDADKSLLHHAAQGLINSSK